MNRRNYRRELDRLTEKLEGTKPRLLLHGCCGPCSSSVLEYLTQYFSVTLLWYNPNIYPEEEFLKRYHTLQEIIEKMGFGDLVRVLAEPRRSEDYYSRIAGLEREPEGGKRCAACFRLRLEETARIAKEQDFDFFCTTLTISRHKNADLINAIGEAVAKETGTKWLPSDFKKRGGEDRSQELSRMYGLYQQRYCGCEFSKKKDRAAADEG